MAKKHSSKRKHSQLKNSINKRKSNSHKILGGPEIQSVAVTEQYLTDVNELQIAHEDVIQQSEAQLDNVPTNDIAKIIETLPTLRGTLDVFLSPNILSGWVFFREGASLRVRIIAGSSILGETYVDRIRPDLMQLNNGLTGWRLETECRLSKQEFVALAKNIRIIILDESNNMIGLIPIRSKLLEILMTENSDAQPLKKEAIA